MATRDPQKGFSNILSALKGAPPLALTGLVTKVTGLVIEGNGPAASVGEICYVDIPGSPPLEAEVVGFREKTIQLMPIGDMTGLTPGGRIRASGGPATVKVGPELLGRVLDGRGEPMDGLAPLNLSETYPIRARPGNPLNRARILKPVDVGVRAINGLLTLGQGQRVGIFAGSGVGKSTLMGMIARHTRADVNVIALVGERGREVREFIEKDLGPEGLRRSVVVAATSEQPALVRMRGAYVGTAIAEYFRDQGQNVILMMDSATRFAYAAREVGLSIGEPATTRGYTPSVFALLPQLLERAGAWSQGSVTGIYTVLVEGDDMNEPVADSMRSILDGHLVLRRELAARNIFPSIDILSSVSRLMTDLATKEHLEAAARFKDTLAIYQRNEDMINIGAYQKGASREIDNAIAYHPRFVDYLKQPFTEGVTLAEAQNDLLRVTAPQPEGPPPPAPGGPGGPGGPGDPSRRRP
ncbi:MAG: FliI/YscN family ATPase [Deltaproteobacteria bacterium]|jgi:flagellum-specific ATP synthase|nr:FliI/YscN family ATPase [Deltaproteobacteria bacterium]